MTTRLNRPAGPLPMNEAEWMRLVVDYAQTIGKWKVYHPKWSMQSASGWPDLAMVRPPRVVLAELKSDKGKATTEQEVWLQLLRECPGVEVYLWRPAHWPEVQEVLR